MELIYFLLFFALLAAIVIIWGMHQLWYPSDHQLGTES